MLTANSKLTAKWPHILILTQILHAHRSSPHIQVMRFPPLQQVPAGCPFHV